MAREITPEGRAVGQKIWEAAHNKYATKGALAKAIGVTPQYLNAYLSGTNRPGIVFFRKLSEAGIDVSSIPGAEDLEPFIHPMAQIPGLSAALADAMDVMRRTPATLARAIGVDASDVESWIKGDGQPGYEALGKLFVLSATCAFQATAEHKRPRPSVATSKRERVA